MGISVALTIFFPTLLLGLLNFAYFGFVQFLPGVLAIIYWRRASKWGIVAGLTVGYICIILFNMFPIVPFNINKGLVSLLANALTMGFISMLSPVDEKSIAKLMLSRRSTSSPKAVR